jgi:hypothetical protein
LNECPDCKVRHSLVVWLQLVVWLHHWHHIFAMPPAIPQQAAAWSRANVGAIQVDQAFNEITASIQTGQTLMHPRQTLQHCPLLKRTRQRC